MMWDSIKWFVYQESWKPLTALYKNSPPNPGAGYSWDRGHSQFSFSLHCLHSPVSSVTPGGTQQLLTRRTLVRGRWRSRRVSVQSKVKDENACAKVRNHLGACMHTPNRQHFVMVLLHLTSPLKRCFCLMLFWLQDVRQMDLLTSVFILFHWSEQSKFR